MGVSVGSVVGVDAVVWVGLRVGVMAGVNTGPAATTELICVHDPPSTAPMGTMSRVQANAQPASKRDEAAEGAPDGASLAASSFASPLTLWRNNIHRLNDKAMR